jgi:hypothetical protein
MKYNPEFDKLLCELDGKITAYRMKNPNLNHEDLVVIQIAIQYLWDINKNGGK